MRWRGHCLNPVSAPALITRGLLLSPRAAAFQPHSSPYLQAAEGDLFLEVPGAESRTTWELFKAAAQIMFGQRSWQPNRRLE
jgi:hypothetical protein